MSDLHSPLTQLKVCLVAAFTFLFCIPAAQATSPIIVSIDSKGTDPKYALNHQPMSGPQLAKFLTEAIEAFGDADPLILDPDVHTTMETLSGVLHILHSSGVKVVYRRTALDDPLGVIDLKASQPAQDRYKLRRGREADYLSTTGSAKAPAAASPGTESTSPR